MKRIQIYTPEQFKKPPYLAVAEGIYARTGAWPGDTLYVTALRLPVARNERRQPVGQSASASEVVRANAELEALLLHFCLLPGEVGEEPDTAGRRIRFIVVMGRSLADMQSLVRSAGKSIVIGKCAYGSHICERLVIK